MEDTQNRTVGSILKGILDERGIRVRKLAEETGVNEQTLYSLIRRGGTKMDIESLLAICKYLGVSPEIFDPGGYADGDAPPDGAQNAALFSPEELSGMVAEALAGGVTADELRLAIALIKKIKKG